MPHFPSSIQSRLPKLGTTIFTVMSKLALENHAINLSQGFPDFETDPKLIDSFYQSMKAGNNQYAPMQGLISLRETISAKTKKAYNIEYNPETEINITSGGTEAIYSAIAAFVREGDEVLIFTPAYDCYDPAVILSGGKSIFVELQYPDFSINWKEVKKLVNRKTRMIIINTPHNPSGSVLKKSDLKELEKITKNTEIIVLSDEVYEHIIFDKENHQSVCLFPGLAERSILVYSFGKMFHITGWKMGYVLAPANLMVEFRKAHQFIVFSSNTPAQVAFHEYMKDESRYLELGNFYQEKRDYFIKGLKGSKFNFTPAAGTYFQLLDYSKISDEKDTEFAIRLTKENKIASIPVSVFYNREVDNKVLRFCFAKKKETLDKALEILQKV
jgi:methionine aminotransferase